MARKPRSDSKLDCLPDEQKQAIAEWLTVENVSYSEARKRAASRFAVTTSLSALQGFYSSFAVAWKYARSKDLADEFSKLSAGQFDKAASMRLQQLLFEVTSTNRVDLRAIKSLAKIVGDSHKLTLAQERLELDRRKVKILEAKAALADSAKGIVGDAELSETDKAARLRQLFGM